MARILEHALWLRKEGYRLPTIRGAIKNLNALARHCNIIKHPFTPEVKARM